MNETPSVFGTPREWALDLAITTAVGGVFGLIGPFGTFNGGPVELRVAYWVANAWVGFVVLSTILRLSMRASIRLDLPVWFVLAMGVAVGAVPLSIEVAYFGAWIWPPNHGQVAPLFQQYGQVLVISEPLAFAYYFLADRGRRGRVRLAQAVGSGPPAVANGAAPSGHFFDRLPARLGRDLLCLKMEDHYVRAHTASGSDLVLMPMKDAIAELAGVEGMQVHRSWWVAKAAVVQAVNEGRNLSLRLSNGLDAPVSRASVARLREAGWLDDFPEPGARQL
jgi:LytTr DNA-binding domain